MAVNDIHEANSQGGAQALARSARDLAPGDLPFAILRYAKLKTAGAIRGSSKHMRRTIPTPNADPALTGSNRILIGSEDPAADVMELVPTPDARSAQGKLLRRKNSVLAVEVLMTTSPEWWRDAIPEEREAWAEKSAAWLRQEWGAENVAHLELHVDETTGHLTGLIVPLDPDTGALNCRRWIGGRASKLEPGTSLLSGHQTRYAEAVQEFGLRRGRLGSTAKHTTVAEYYRRAGAVLEAEVKPPQVGKPPLLGRERWAQDLQAKIDVAVGMQAVGAAEARTERAKARAAGRDHDRSQATLEAARAARKELADQMRSLPLPDVLAALGLEEDKKEPGLWKAGPKGARTHRIAIKGSKWFDHAAQYGRGGAIDVVQHVMETDFNGALAWLGGAFGQGAATAEYRSQLHAKAARVVERATEARAPFTPPTPDPSSWPAVRKHLIEERALPAELVDATHAAGDLYAVSHKTRGTLVLRNACFIQRGADGVPTGAELKGIVRGIDGKRWSGLAAGSSKSSGVFRTGVDLARAAGVFIVESAIDAMSLAARLGDRMRKCVILSSAGDNTMPSPILDALRPEAARFAAQDANDAGDRQAKRLGEGWKRVRPPAPFADWNDELVASAQHSSSGGSEKPAESGPDTEPPSPAF